MYRKLLGLAVGMVVTIGVGASALAAQQTVGVNQDPITVDPNEVFTATSNCFQNQSVEFTFNDGEPQVVPCDVPEQEEEEEQEGPPSDLQQGFRLPAVPTPTGTASADFTAPAESGTYDGTIEVLSQQQDQPQGLRSGFATPSRVIAPQGVAGPSPFAVIVRAAATTTVAPTTLAPTTVPPTTLAPTAVAPTTVAPSTTAAAVASPTTVAPVTTLAVSTVLPATGPSRNDNIAVIVFVLLLLGSMLIVATRWRPNSAD